MATFSPCSVDEVIEIIRLGLSTRSSFAIKGSATRSLLGRPIDLPHQLELRGLEGIVRYQPEELVLTARAGTPMSVIEQALAERGQSLAFEPPSMRALAPGADALGLPGGTLGGVVATGLSGPRRVTSGAVRDHVLGIAAISGRAEAFVSGGRVVKNVTGFDVPKLLTGSYGTLAVFAEITLKVAPAAEDVRTLLVHGLDAHASVRAMARALECVPSVSGAAYVPSPLIPHYLSVRDSITALRVEGIPASVRSRLDTLRSRLGGIGGLSVLDRETSISCWQDLRDATPVASGDAIVWRLSVPPAQGANVLARIVSRMPQVQGFLDWAGGLIWLRVCTTNFTITSCGQACAGTLRAAIEECGGGHATMVRAPVHVRAAAQVMQPPSPGVAALIARVKAQFDPFGVLNPGRMYAEI